MATEMTVAPGEHGKSGRWLILGVGVCALGLGVWFFRDHRQAGGTSGAAPSGSSAEARPIPVVVANAAPRDVPVYLEGLGNATPLVTVTVKPQVDGRLDAVLFQEGQAVKKGDLIARIDPRPFTIQLHTAEAALARDRAQHDNAGVNFQRYTALHEQGLATQEQLDDQRATFEQLGGTIKADQAQIESARLQLDYAQVKSPIDGVTGVRLVDQGNIVHASDATGLVVITQVDPMAVVFTLPQDNLPQINKEISGGLAIEVYGRDGVSLLGKGKLTLVDNQVSVSTATVKLKGVVPNPDKALWPNAFVRARLLLATRKGVLAIPAPAVQRGPQGTFVYIVAPDQTAALRPVVVENAQDQWAIVTRGLNAGDRVVTEGQNQLRPGSKVAIHESAAGAGLVQASDAPGATGETGDTTTGTTGHHGGGGSGGKRSGAQP